MGRNAQKRKRRKGCIQNGGHCSSIVGNNLETLITMKQYDLTPTYPSA